MSDCYAIACESCKVSLWIGQQGGNSDFYVYTTEPETSNFSRFLKTHQGHPLVFGNTQDFIYSHSDLEETDDGPT
jgi:hypothetical protein